MRLGVATPGVSLATVRRCLDEADRFASVVRARRCGRLGVSLESVTTLTLYVRRCTVSIHTAERVLDTLDPSDDPLCSRVCVVDGRSVPRWLRRRFDCPVRSAASDAVRRVASGNQRTS